MLFIPFIRGVRETVWPRPMCEWIEVDSYTVRHLQNSAPQHGERQALHQGRNAILNDHPSRGFLAYRNTDLSHVSRCMCGSNFGSGPRLDRWSHPLSILAGLNAGYASKALRHRGNERRRHALTAFACCKTLRCALISESR